MTDLRELGRFLIMEHEPQSSMLPTNNIESIIYPKIINFLALLSLCQLFLIIILILILVRK
jgi:hypothetical protein